MLCRIIGRKCCGVRPVLPRRVVARPWRSSNSRSRNSNRQNDRFAVSTFHPRANSSASPKGLRCKPDRLDGAFRYKRVNFSEVLPYGGIPLLQARVYGHHLVGRFANIGKAFCDSTHCFAITKKLLLRQGPLYPPGYSELLPECPAPSQADDFLCCS